MFKGCYIYKGSKKIEYSGLFRKFMSKEASPDGCDFTRTELQWLGQALCMMHCHSVKAESDHVHQRSRDVISSLSPLWRQVQATSFFLEFSFATQFADADDIGRIRSMSPASFAKWCWTHRCVPVTPRHGILSSKPLHKQLKDHAAAGNEVKFQEGVVGWYADRVLSTTESKNVAACLDQHKHDNRVDALRKQLFEKDDFGKLSVKNTIEALAASHLLKTVSQAEWARLPDGDGAQKFWKHSKTSRPEMTASVLSFFKTLETDDDLKVVFADGFEKSVPFSSLGLRISDITERLSQFWGCAQCRILTVFEVVRRGGGDSLIPYHLLPNKAILADIEAHFDRGTTELYDDESSEDSASEA